MCGRYYFSVDLLDGIRELVEQGDWKLELGLLEKDMHPGDVAPVITIREDTARGNAERGNTERGNESQAPVSVSYTHLDVYKRQGLRKRYVRYSQTPTRRPLGNHLTGRTLCQQWRTC